MFGELGRGTSCANLKARAARSIHDGTLETSRIRGAHEDTEIKQGRPRTASFASTPRRGYGYGEDHRWWQYTLPDSPVDMSVGWTPFRKREVGHAGAISPRPIPSLWQQSSHFGPGFANVDDYRATLDLVFTLFREILSEALV